MSEKKFVVKHHLDQLSAEELTQYLRDVSTYIGLDPDLNGLDTLWMDNESGVGRSLVVYAKRGTAEILRNIYKISVIELTHTQVGGSIVFTAAGQSAVSGRVERATGSKYIKDLVGKALDNGIMTASTRALRRLTMQFTTLGILDESEVVDFVGQPVNPAAGVQLAGSPVVIPPAPLVPVNNGPGTEMLPVSQDPRTQAQVATVIAIREIEKIAAAPPVDKITHVIEKTVIEHGPEPTPAEKIKKPRKSKNTVSLEVEPEVVNNAPAEPVICVDCKTPLSGHPLVNSVRTCPTPTQTVAAVAPTPAPAPPPVPTAPLPVINAASTAMMAAALDMPTKEQMDEYRKKIGVFTQQLPATPGLGSVQRMRAFITKMFNAAPQNLNAAQWIEVIAWFDDFSTRNGVKGLLKFINDTLGDVPKS